MRFAKNFVRNFSQYVLHKNLSILVDHLYYPELSEYIEGFYENEVGNITVVLFGGALHLKASPALEIKPKN